MFVETGQQSAQKPADTARADDRYSRFHRPDRIWFYDAKIAKRTSARHPGAKKNIGFLAGGLAARKPMLYGQRRHRPS